MNEDSPILIFDGMCHLCDGSVDFLLRHEREPALRFVPWQSELGRKLLERHGLWREEPESMVLIHRGRALTHSGAVMGAARWLKLPYRLVRLFRVVPAPLRDAVYRWVAANRYRWFGRSDTCRLPEPSQRHRFLA